MGSIIKNFLSPDSVFYRLRTFNVYGFGFGCCHTETTG